jgi:hypothetical protein
MHNQEPTIIASNSNSLNGKRSLNVKGVNDKNVRELVDLLNKNVDTYELNLWCNNISLEGLKILISHLPQSIQILDLHSNFINDECIPVLLECLTLNVIKLDNNPLTDKAANLMLQCNRKISISVTGCEMSDFNKSQVHAKFPLPTPSLEEVHAAMEQSTSMFYRANSKPIDTRKIIKRVLTTSSSQSEIREEIPTNGFH